LTADLLAHLRQVARRFQGVLGKALRGLIVDIGHRQELAGLLQAQVGRLTAEEQIAAILSRAVARGEVDPGVVRPRVVALPLDLLRHEALVHGTPVPDAAVVAILDDVVLPLLTGAPTAPTPARRPPTCRAHPPMPGG